MHKISSMLLTLLFCISCLATNKQEEKEDNRMNELQLQEEVQRFYTRFTERVVESGVKDKVLTQRYREETLKQYLLYDSEALKIATAPYPMVNLLDMIVFIKLNKMAIRDYWIPKVYGPDGEFIYKAFADSEKDIEQVAHKILSNRNLADLNEYVLEWRKKNPTTVRVEKIRFGDFSQYAKSYDEGGPSKFSLVDTQSAVKAVDQMILLGNRGVFLAQHMPLILRLHTRLGAQEIIADTMSNMNSGAQMMEDIQGTQPLVEDLTSLVRESNSLVSEIQDLTSHTKSNFPKINIQKSITDMSSLVDKSTALVRELRSGAQASDELHKMILFMAFVIILIGTALAIIWWSGYYICKRLLLQSEKQKTV